MTIQERVAKLEQEVNERFRTFFIEQVQQLFVQNPELESFGFSGEQAYDDQNYYFEVIRHRPDINGVDHFGKTGVYRRDLADKVCDFLKQFPDSFLGTIFGDYEFSVTLSRDGNIVKN